MAKAKKDGDYLHCYIKSDIMADLNAYVEETEYSKTVVVEKAIKCKVKSNRNICDFNGVHKYKYCPYKRCFYESAGYWSLFYFYSS